MNKIFRLIWSRVKEAWVIVAEKVKGNGGPAPVTVGVALITASLAVGSGVATALPTGAQIASGTVGINTVGNVMTVTNSANAIINWQNFSIGNNETARFVQPSALSAVLNRVTGGNPSQILGALQSNGKVLLINPSGIIFGAGARVDVNGLIASSLDIANQDFLAGRMKFTAGPTAGKVENQGTITTPTGGSVYLIAPDVQNSGVITAPNGDVLLAAGKEVLLVDSSNPEIAMVVTAPDGQSINLGTIVTDAGRVGMYGSVVRQKGRISADSAVSEGGKIFFKATKQATLEQGSITSATGTKGGAVQVLGQHAGLLNNAVVDVSGTNGGGTVLVGGDYQGKNAAIPNAEVTYLGKDTVIKADATDNGNGGKVIVWADNATRAYGSIYARAGANGGDGGFVETSGKQFLDVNGINVNTLAVRGRIGSWLLDPINIDVKSTTPDYTNLNQVDAFADSQVGTYGYIAPATINAAASDVILQATNSITVTDAINMTNTGVGITAQAGGDITINAPVRTQGGAINLIANDPACVTGWAAITIGATGGLDATNSGTNPTGATISLVNTGSVNGITVGGTLNAGSNNNVTLHTDGTVASSATASISAKGLELLGGGAFALTNGTYAVQNLAGAVAGDISFTNTSGNLTIGTVNTVGLTSSGGNISIIQNGGALTVAQNVSAPSAGKSVSMQSTYLGSGDLTVSAATISADSNISLGTGFQGEDIIINGATMTSTSGDITVQPATEGNITLNGGSFTAGVGKAAKFVVDNVATPVISIASPVSGNSLVYKTDLLSAAAKTTATGSITLLPATTGGVVDFGGGGSGVLVLPDGNLSTKFDTPILRLGMPGAGEKVGGVSFNPTANTVSGLNTLSIYSSGPVSQGTGATIGATALQVTASSVTLTEDNPVGVIAGKATTSDFSYKSTNSIAVSTVDGVVGITGFDPASCVYLTSDMGINQAAGSPITVNGSGLYLTAGGPVNLMEPTNAASGWFSAALTGSGSLNFTNSTGVTLSSISSSNQPISFTTSTGDLTVNNSINAGTSYVALKTPGNLFITGGGDPVSVSGQSVKLEASGLSMSYGGYGASVDASNISIATDTFTTSGAVALNATSGISIQTLTSGREIAVGTGATGAGLVVNDLTSALFNTSHLRIGNDNTTGSYGAYSGTIAVGGSGISRPTLQLGLTTAGAISQTAPVAVSSLGLISGSGQNIVLMDSTNSVASLAGKSGGQFSFAGTGSLALASMTGGVPAVTLNGITASGAVALSSSSGSITDSVASVPAITAPSATLSAYSGIGVVGTPLKTQVSSLSATNSMAGDIQVVNTGALTTGAISNPNATGKVSITAQSPLTIGAPLTAGDDIALTAGASGTGVLTDILTINAAVTSSGGNIALSAGNGIVENAAVTPGSGKTVVRTASLNPSPTCSTGYAWNGIACAPTVSTCTTDPSLPGCSGILPGLDICTSEPATPGCTAVLPTIATCTSAPATPGCSAVLPTIATCTATPTAPGCSAVLPTLATCTSAPATPGCSAVLPTIATCTATPTAPGCSAVLPTLATCTSAPATPGCSAVLPTIATCTATPTTPGCSAVLPTLATCTSAPATPGCSAVLPTIATCTATPTAPGCSAVLPTIATCTSAPATPGCSAVLPTIATCTATPAAPGCSAVLPTIATCTSAPTTTGCSAVLPSLASCTATPFAPGCSVVLPTIATCSSNPATPGCSAVMPSLATCIASPGTIGCGAVLPSMQSCVAAPTTPGCSAVLPTLADCAANPSAPGCVVVVPVVENKELAPKTNQLVNSLNPLPTSPVTPAGLKLIAQAPPAQSSSGGGGGGTGDGGNNSEDKDKDKNRNGQGQPPTGGGNTDEKPKKNYCN